MLQQRSQSAGVLANDRAEQKTPRESCCGKTAIHHTCQPEFRRAKNCGFALRRLGQNREAKRVRRSPPVSHSGVDAIFVNTSALPGLIVVCFGRFWVRDLPFPNARRLGHPFQWKNTLPWHIGSAAKVRILRFKNLPPFRHYPGLQNHV